MPAELAVKPRFAAAAKISGAALGVLASRFVTLSCSALLAGLAGKFALGT